MFKRIDHVELAPSRLDVTIDFYVRVLGFEERERIQIHHPPLRQVVYLGLGDTVVELLDYENPEPPLPKGPRVGYVALALEVDSMDQALTHLKEHGIHPTIPPFDAGGGSLRAEITDPDGLAIELRQW
jgi:glyoxylase I family protein